MTALLHTVWPPQESKDLPIPQVTSTPHVEKHLLLRHHGKLVGYAKIFSRELTAGDRTIRNMALGAVCVHPEARQFGYGRGLVKAAFGYVDNGTFECSVFQTAVSGFYEKLGARVITTSFFDGVNKNAQPWWDKCLMVYPAVYDLGPGPLDLNGPAY